MATDDAASAPRTRALGAVDSTPQSPNSKMDGTRAAAIPTNGDDEANGSQRDLLDVDEMLLTMKQSAQQLDAMLQRIYAHSTPPSSGGEANASEAGEGDDDAREAVELHPVAALAGDATPLACEMYFEAIRMSFVQGHHVGDRALRGLLPGVEGDELKKCMDAKAFLASTRDVTYMFPAPAVQYVGETTVDEEWDMAEALTLDQFQQRIATCLDHTDHAVPPAVATAIAARMAYALVDFSAGDCELKAIDVLFPTLRVAADTHVEWRRGNRICKVWSTEREWRRQWGLEVVLTLETVARAQGLTVAAGGVATVVLGPPLSCTVECRTFVPKARYKDTGQVSSTSSLRLTFAVEGEANASAKTDYEAASVEDEKPTEKMLPEFMDVWQWGGHAALSSNGESSSPIQGIFDNSTGFQKLDIRAPFPSNRIVQAACGRLHTLLLNDVGMVFSYGHAIDGALGHGDALRPSEIVVAQPKLLDFFFDRAIPVRSVACGGDDLTGFHSAAVAHDGSVFTWGVGPALGLGSVKSHSTPQRVTMPPQEEPTSTTVVSVSCGSGFCVVLASDGSAFAWGKWSDGRLGLGAIPILHKSARQHGNRRQLQRFQLSPKRITCPTAGGSPVQWRKVSCGDTHCVALSRTGLAYVWGRGRQGQLGLGGVRDAMTPVALSKKQWRDVAAGQDWSMAVDTHGAVWSWGACGAAVLGLSNGDDADRSADIAELLLQKHFQLRQRASAGDNSTSTLVPPPRFHWLRPQPIPSLSHGDAAIRSVSAGARHAAAISERGDLYVWGSPQQGLSSQPTLMISSDAGIGSTIAEQVFCGGSHVITLTSGSFLASAMQHLYKTLQSRNDSDTSDPDDQRDNRQRPPAGADLALIVGGGKALFAHKLVLARRSSVLRELILNEERPVMSAGAAATPSVTEVLLPQLRLEIARVLLEFLYSDNLTTSLDPLSYLIRDVLRAAREFKIPRLARICRERIESASYLSLAATLRVELDEIDHGKPKDHEEEDQTAHSLNADLAFAFGDATWSDLRIVAEGRAIPVHKCMLLARSEYFRALLAFYDQQDETDPSAVPGGRELVVDESYLGMLRVLKFIYNDELTTLDKQRPSQHAGQRDEEEAAEQDERTEQLLEDLIAADKYGLVRMKRLCEHHIAVTHSNCLDVLVVADLVHADHLKQVAMAFVQINLHVLSEPRGASVGTATVLQRLALEFPHLLTELYDRIQRTTQQQTLLREWQSHVERDALAHHARQTQQWQQTSEATAFPWVPLILAFVFATLYLSVMNAHESDYPVVPAINLVVVGGLLAAAFAGKV